MLSKFRSIFGTNKDDARRKELLFDKLQPRDIFIDCGANTGQETVPALKKGAIVYAFEPHPAAFAALKKNVGSAEGATLIEMGVWDKKRTIKLYLHQNHDQDAVGWSQGASLVSEKANVDTSKFVDVETIDLADYILKLERQVKVLKIDVEGVEFDILRRLINSGAYKKVDHILVETHTRKMKHLEPKEIEIKQLIAQKKIKNISLDWM